MFGFLSHCPNDGGSDRRYADPTSRRHCRLVFDLCLESVLRLTGHGTTLWNHSEIPSPRWVNHRNRVCELSKVGVQTIEASRRVCDLSKPLVPVGEVSNSALECVNYRNLLTSRPDHGLVDHDFGSHRFSIPAASRPSSDARLLRGGCVRRHSQRGHGLDGASDLQPVDEAGPPGPPL